MVGQAQRRQHKRITTQVAGVPDALQVVLSSTSPDALVEERHRIARELHDSISPLLFSIVLNCEMACSLAESNPFLAKTHMEKVSERANQTRIAIRSLLYKLRPITQWGGGLADALDTYIQTLCQDGCLPITFRVSGEGTVPPLVEDHLFRIAQEALNNVIRHAQASSALVELTLRPGVARLSIKDDGAGSDSSRFEHGNGEGLGLSSMSERMELLGGCLRVDSRVGEGTRIVAEVPILNAYE